jgi:hypothetical protein
VAVVLKAAAQTISVINCFVFFSSFFSVSGDGFGSSSSIYVIIYLVSFVVVVVFFSV